MIDTEKIRRLREAKDLTQDEAAKGARMKDRSHWNHIETGRRKNITLDLLDRVARVLGVKAKDLLK